MKAQVIFLSVCLALTCFLCAMIGSDIKDLKNRVTELEYIVKGE